MTRQIIPLKRNEPEDVAALRALEAARRQAWI